MWSFAEPRMPTHSPAKDATAPPWALNLALAAAVLLIYVALFRGAALLASGHLGLFAGVLLGFLIITPTIWGLIHEGIHGRLARPLPANRAAARALCILLGFSFDTVQFGHLTHHRYSGHEYDRPDRIQPGESVWISGLRHWGHLFGGHYLFTALVSTVAFTPARARARLLQRALSGPQADIVAIRHAALKWFANQNRILRIRFDFAASVLVIALTLIHYAAFWPLLLAALCGRAIIYSTLDNLPHYGMQGRGDEAAKNLTVPAWLSYIVLNHNLHRIHHEQPNLSWRVLPAHLADRATHGNYLLAAIRQFSGPTNTRG
jgi:fatty acid desaturase